MKKQLSFILLCILIVVFSVSSCLADNPEICDGIELGMIKEDVIRIANSNGLPINSMGVYETTVANQPFSVVELFFTEDISNFVPAELSDIDAHVADDLSDMNLILSQNAPGKLLSTEEDTGWILAQISVNITSDYRYITAVETFQDIEELLIQQYGNTRYTSRRGQSLPMVEGYSAPARLVIMHDIPKVLSHDAEISVPDYSQRIISLSDGRYMVIDHHISTRKKDGENTFSHRLIFSLIPVDISVPLNLKIAETQDPVLSVPTPKPIITDSTVLYYNPSGGERYHLDIMCGNVNDRYLPLQGHFTFSELNNPKYAKLIPCPYCDAPAKPSEETKGQHDSVDTSFSSPELGINSDTVLYYDVSGGERYHLDKMCSSVDERHLPLQGHFTFSELSKPKYSKLKPCPDCGAPERVYDISGL